MPTATTLMPPPESTVSDHHPVNQVAGRLKQAREATLRARTLAIACAIVGAAAALLSFVALIDYFLELPFAIRALGLLGVLSAAAASAWQIVRTWIAGYS